MTVGISDHTPQFALVPTYSTIKPKVNQTKKIRKYKDINITQLNQDLNCINWTMESDDVNQYGTNFINVFNQILNVHAPMKEIKMTKSKLKQNAKPWINNDTSNLIKLKDKLYSKYIKEVNATTKLNILKRVQNQEKRNNSIN